MSTAAITIIAKLASEDSSFSAAFSRGVDPRHRQSVLVGSGGGTTAPGRTA
jgi:hypothetical protein